MVMLSIFKEKINNNFRENECSWQKYTRIFNNKMSPKEILVSWVHELLIYILKGQCHEIFDLYFFH